MTPVQNKRPAHRPSRRKEIIDAATQAFSRDGYVEARIEDIARAAGVAPTAIYYHFGGKEELFTQALRAAMTGFSERIYLARPDFDAPNNDVTFFPDFSGPPSFPPEGSLGMIQHTVGSPRFLQLALHLSF